MQRSRLPRHHRRVDTDVTGPQRVEKRDLVRIHINVHSSPASLLEVKGVGMMDRVKGPYIDKDAALDLKRFIEPPCQPRYIRQPDRRRAASTLSPHAGKRMPELTSATERPLTCPSYNGELTASFHIFQH